MGGHSYSSHHYGGGGRVSYSSGGGNNDPTVYLYMLIIAAIIAYCITAGILYPKAKNDNTVLGLSETRPISISSTWHQSISVGSPSNFNTTASATLMRFKSMPPVGSTDSWALNQPNTPLASYDNYWWSWYLAPGSSLTFTWGYSIPINVYLIKSDAGLSAYNRDASITKYLEASYSQRSSGSISFTVKSGDIYYAIVENWYTSNSASGGANFTIHSVQYNMNNPDFKCSLPCDITVPYGSTDKYFFYTPTVTSQLAAGKGGPLSEISFKLKVASRAWFVGVILFFIPLTVLISLLVFSIWWFQYRDPKDPCKCFSGCCSSFSSSSSYSGGSSSLYSSHSVEMSPTSSPSVGGGSVITSEPTAFRTPTDYSSSAYTTPTPYPDLTPPPAPELAYTPQPAPVSVDFVPNPSMPAYDPNAAPFNEYNMPPPQQPAPYNPDPAPAPYNPDPAPAPYNPDPAPAPYNPDAAPAPYNPDPPPYNPNFS